MRTRSKPHVFVHGMFDYPFYETLDVRFYGSMPLIKFWPDIEKGVMKEFADTVPQESRERMVWIWKTRTDGTAQYRIRKAKGAVPHDLGVPNEDPFKQINQFSWQDTNGWKDLNPKFVLLVYRDFVLSGASDTAFLKYTWPAVQRIDRLSEAVRYRWRRHSGEPGISGSDVRRMGGARGKRVFAADCGWRRCARRKKWRRNWETPNAASEYHSYF